MAYAPSCFCAFQPFSLFFLCGRASFQGLHQKACCVSVFAQAASVNVRACVCICMSMWVASRDSASAGAYDCSMLRFPEFYVW